MVAIVTGTGLGLERSSASVVGLLGQYGQSRLGRAGDNVYVNAANGNLVIQNTDEMLMGLGPDSVAAARTYNSKGLLTDDNGDNWRPGGARKIALLTGTAGVSGTVMRTDWDGSDVIYTWDASRSAYVSKEGAGAYDTISFAGSTWTWRDGDSRVTETYDNANGGRILTSADTDGNSLTFTYNAGGLLARVATQNGEYTDFTYVNTNQLSQVVTSYHPDTAGTDALKTLTRTRYGYDAQGRLSTVTVDLTPGDTADNATYVTTYTYTDTTNKRVASISQTDGSLLQIGYSEITTGDFRVTSLTQTVSSGVTRVTTIAYNTATRVTTVTDPAGQATVLTYDASGQLLSLASPSIAGAGAGGADAPRKVEFTYDADGNVTSLKDGKGNVTTYGYNKYDPATGAIVAGGTDGLRTRERDALGDTIVRTFGANNELLTETHYTGVDPDAGDTGAAPTGATTTRYVYDTENHLRYAVSAEGRVTEYRYTAVGLVATTVQYVGNTYSTAGLSAWQSPSLATLDSWRDAIADKSNTKRVDTTYDYRGLVRSVTTYGKVLASGVGVTAADADVTQTIYTYDQAGNLLTRQVAGSTQTEIYAYDGLGRLVASTEFGGASTSTVFDDATSRTVVTNNATGLTETSIYNLAGELITQQSSGTGALSIDTAGSTSLGVDALYADDFKFLSRASTGAAFDALKYDLGAAKWIESVSLKGVRWVDGASGAATVQVFGSNDGVNWTSLTTYTLSGSAPQDFNTASINAIYRYVKLTPTTYTAAGKLEIDRFQPLGGDPPTMAPLVTPGAVTATYVNPTSPSNVTAADGNVFVSDRSHGAAFNALQYDFGVGKSITSVQLQGVKWLDGATGAATVKILGSNDYGSWTQMASYNLSGGAAQTTASTAVNATYRYVIVQVTSFTANGQLSLDCLHVVGHDNGSAALQSTSTTIAQNNFSTPLTNLMTVDASYAVSNYTFGTTRAITYDFGTAKTLTSFTIDNTKWADGGNGYAYVYAIGSNDNTNWTNLGGANIYGTSNHIEAAVSGSYRYVALQFGTNSWGNLYVDRFQVNGLAAPADVSLEAAATASRVSALTPTGVEPGLVTGDNAAFVSDISSGGQAFDALNIDLGVAKWISTVSLDNVYWSDGQGASGTSFATGVATATVMGSLDGVTWTDAATFSLSGGTQQKSAVLNGTYRYLKLRMSAFPQDGQLVLDRIQVLGADAAGMTAVPLQGVKPVTGLYSNPNPVTNAAALDGNLYISSLATGAPFDAISYDLGAGKTITAVQLDNVTWVDGASGSATVQIYGSTDGTTWTSIATKTLSGSAAQNLAATAVNASYRYIKASVTSFTTGGRLSIDRLDVSGYTTAAVGVGPLQVASGVTTTGGNGGTPANAKVLDGTNYLSNTVYANSSFTAITYDFGAQKALNSFSLDKISWNDGNSGIAYVYVRGSNDGTNWTNLSTLYLAGGAQSKEGFISGNYRYVSLYYGSSQFMGALSVDRFQVNGTVIPAATSLQAQPGALITTPGGAAPTAADLAIVKDGVSFISQRSSGSAFDVLSYDYGTTKWISKVELEGLKWLDGATGAATLNVLMSNDGLTWTTVNNLALSGSSLQNASSIPVGGLYRYVKLRVSAFAKDGQLNVDHFQAFGADGSSFSGGVDLASSAGPGVKTYRYDNLGRLRVATDTTGLRTLYYYDATGRLTGQVGADGSVVGYRYGLDDQLIQTTQRATRLTTTELAALVNASGDATSNILPTVAAAAGDRWEWRVYDAAGRLAGAIDNSGAVTAYSYDGASRLIATTSYANVLSASIITGYQTGGPPATVQLPTASAANDRVARLFYDNDGLLIGSLDGEGYFSETVYDAAGQKIETIRYAAPASAGLWATGSFSAIRAEVAAVVDPSADTIHEYVLYDKRGLVAATIDGEGNLTRNHYTAQGYLDQTVSGQKLDPAALIATRPTLATLPAATTEVLDVVSYTRNLYGQVLTESKTLASGTDVITYTYDSARRLVETSTVTAWGDNRKISYRYDARGRMVSMLSGRGNQVLAAPPAGMTAEDVWAAYATHYTYDSEDRLISKTDPAGLGPRSKTLYFYDKSGALSHEVNALGEVTGYLYNAFGERTDVTLYATPITASNLATLKGGANSLVTSLVQTSASDSTIHLDYNVSGEVAASTDALGNQTTYAYDAFGEEISRTAPLAASASVINAATYDRRGLLKTSTRDVGGLALLTSYTYDAFGRAIQVTDPGSGVNQTRYDRVGRVVTTTDALGKVTTYTYDGRDNLLTSTDRNGKVTSYSYSQFNRTVTVSTPEGVVTTSLYNAYGQTVQISDGAGRKLTYTYDKNGELVSVTDDLGNVTQNFRDMAGRLRQTVDARGIATDYTYDAANRVLTRTVDSAAGGLGLVTTYAYDAKGQRVSVTDPSGVVTTTTFDKKGQKTEVAVNAAGLNLRTAYEYDKAGRSTKVTEGYGTAAAKVTTYDYDKADRLVASHVDPAVMNLSAGYTYDSRGNLTAVTGPMGGVTRYAYDADNRQIYSADPTGAVVQTTYDAEGRVVVTRAYATPITGGAALSSVTANNSLDEITRYAYDGNGRLRFAVNGIGQTTEYIYDGAGNVTRLVRYGQTYTATTTTVLLLSDMVAFAATNAAGSSNRVSQAMFDAANRQVFSVDALGGVTRYNYDAAGNVTKQVQFNATYSGAGDLASITAWADGGAIANDAANRNSRVLYDAAGRGAFSVDAESYVTETQYNAAGQVLKQIRYADRYTVTDSSTAATLKTAIGAVPTTAVVTAFEYDAAGRLIASVDGVGARTEMTLNALGLVTTLKVAAWTSDEAITTRAYDAAGRMTSETRGVGMTVPATTVYGYDGAGRLTLVSDPDGWVTTNTYDAAGRLLTTSKPISATASAATTNQYDAFGNLAKVTDPRGNAGYFYYDRLNRLTYQVDPEGYVTKTDYGALGDEVMAVTRYATKISGTPVVGTIPTITLNAAKDATTSFTRDKLDRLTATTDAELYIESFTLNAFGDRISVTNKIGGVITYTYDKRGLTLTEVVPANSVLPDATGVLATSITNKFEYDARGNRTKTIEALGLVEQRTTTFVYDKLDRLVQKIQGADGVTISGVTKNLANGNFTVTSSLGTSTYDYRGRLLSGPSVPEVFFIANNFGTNSFSASRPTDTTVYDLRGNVTATVDPNGARTLYYYDDLNRKVAQVDPVGALKTWLYDANGNAVAETSWATLLNNAALAIGGNAPSPADTVGREVRYSYDRNNRLVGTQIRNVRTGVWNGSSYATSIIDINTTTVYDAAGNVIQQIDGNGGSTTYTYDKLGRRTLQWDQAGYATSWEYDGEGNVTREVRCATPGGYAGGNDRITEFTYDKNGRRRTETRKNVAIMDVAANAAVTVATVDVTMTYTYNGLGQVTSKTEGNGDKTTYGYDAAGRLTGETGPSFVDYQGATVANAKIYYYNGLNQVTRTTEVDVNNWNTSNTTVHTVGYYYGGGGRLLATQDSLNFYKVYSYDAAGRVVAEDYARTVADVAFWQGANQFTRNADVYVYDAAGRVTAQTTLRLIQGVWKTQWSYNETATGNNSVVWSNTWYNAYGDVVARGSNSIQAEVMAYDGAGRLVRSNVGDGVTRMYFYDANGNATLTVQSRGKQVEDTDPTEIDLSLYTPDQVIAMFTGVNGTVGTQHVPKLIATYTLYDARNLATGTVQTFRELNEVQQRDQGQARQTLTTFTGYNAFGEVTAETDALGRVTSYSYNTMGKLTQTLKANGTSNNYYYDRSGRLDGTQEASGAVVWRTLLAGSGYNGEDAKALKEFHADGGTVTMTYDVYGNMRRRTDEIGRIQDLVYDKESRLIQEINWVGTSQELTDYYKVDELGRRIAHWNSFYGSSVQEWTDYDEKGRVARLKDFGGNSTTYYYAFGASLGGSHWYSSHGYYTKATTNSTGGVSWENYDTLGHLLGTTGLNGLNHNYIFNNAGQTIGDNYVAADGVTVRNTRQFTYFNTGQLSAVRDIHAAGNDAYQSTYSRYDAVGNKVSEVQFETVTTASGAAVLVNGQRQDTTSRQTTTTYDVLNRVLTLTENHGGYDTASTAYTYDVNGNVLSSTASFTDPIDYTTSTQAITYAYDSMNRLVAKTTNNNGVYTGTTMLYNAAGQRVQSNTDGKLEIYGYDGAGYLSSTQVWEGGVKTQSTDIYHDTLGRLTLYGEFAWVNGTAYTKYLRHNIIYGAQSQQIVSEQSVLVRDDGNVIQTITANYYTNTSINNNALVIGNLYLGGSLGGTSVSTHIYTNGQWQTRGDYNLQHWTTGSATDQFSFREERTSNTYWGDDGAGVKQLGGATALTVSDVIGWTTYSSNYTFETNGNLKSADILDGQHRTVDFLTDFRGQVVNRTERHWNYSGELQSVVQIDRNYYFDGLKWGSVSNDGLGDEASTFAAAMTRRRMDPGNAPYSIFRNGSPSTGADFDQSYEAINPSTTASTGSSYSVQVGDTLQSVALAVWGDAGLWYLIAEANNLTGGAQLLAGQSLSIPNKVHNSHNNADTFKPYDPNFAQGDLDAAQAPQPKPKGQACGGFGQILLIVIAIVVVAIVAPYATAAIANATGAVATTAGAAGATVSGGLFGTVAGVSGGLSGAAAFAAGGAIAGAAGSIASQLVGVATGIQDKFSWKAVGMAAIGGAVSGGLFGKAGIFNGVGGSGWTGAAIRGAIGNAVTQGIGVASGLQDKFDWTGVAVGGVVGGVGHLAGNWTTGHNISGWQADAVTGLSGGIAGAATRSLITGTDFGDNLMAVLPDVIGTTIGNAIAGGLASRKPGGSAGTADERGGDPLGSTADDRAAFMSGVRAGQAGSAGLAPAPLSSDADFMRDRDRSYFVEPVGEGGSGGIGSSGNDYVSQVEELVVTAKRATAEAATTTKSWWQKLTQGFKGAVHSFLDYTRGIAHSGLTAARSVGHDVLTVARNVGHSDGFKAANRIIDRAFTTVGEGQVSLSNAWAVTSPSYIETIYAVSPLKAAVITMDYVNRSYIDPIVSPIMDTPLGDPGTYESLRGIPVLSPLAAGGRLATTVGRTYVDAMAAERLARIAPAVDDVAVARTLQGGRAEIATIDGAGGASLRLQYMGATPDKFSRTGAEVVARMQGQGLIQGEGPLLRGNPNGLQLIEGDGSLVTIDAKVDMAHTTDAVTWWNETGRFFGAKSPEVRQFMLNSDNYVLQPSSINRSAGASLRQTYQPPAPPDFTTLRR